MLITTKAVVLGTHKYGESDLIVKAFTQSSGLRSYLIRGVMKSKKGKFRASQFLLLTQLEIVASHKDKGTLERLRDAKIIYPYQNLHTDIRKSSVIFFLGEVLRNAVKEEEANHNLYDYLETSLQWFDQQEKAPNFHLFFLLKLTRYLGFYPDDSQKHQSYFNLVDGTFQDVESSEYCISGVKLELLNRLLGTDFEGLHQIKLNKQLRSEILVMLLDYYTLHLHGFHKPKSLTVLNELFD